MCACNNTEPNVIQTTSPEGEVVEMISEGEKISPDGALSVTEFLDRVDQYGGVDPVKLEAKIAEVCIKKGCWMNLNLGSGEEMMVRFKDYGFFVPLDAAGKTAVVQGKAYYDTLSVEDLRHYAKDGGATDQEIAEITEPKASLSFEAVGVLIKP